MRCRVILLLHLLTAAYGTNETKEPRRINSAYRGKADSIQAVYSSQQLCLRQVLNFILCSIHRQFYLNRENSAERGYSGVIARKLAGVFAGLKLGPVLIPRLLSNLSRQVSQLAYHAPCACVRKWRWSTEVFDTTSKKGLNETNGCGLSTRLSLGKEKLAALGMGRFWRPFDLFGRGATGTPLRVNRCVSSSSTNRQRLHAYLWTVQRWTGTPAQTAAIAFSSSGAPGGS
jgi:hypothetical protein